MKKDAASYLKKRCVRRCEVAAAQSLPPHTAQHAPAPGSEHGTRLKFLRGILQRFFRMVREEKERGARFVSVGNPLAAPLPWSAGHATSAPASPLRVILQPFKFSVQPHYIHFTHIYPLNHHLTIRPTKPLLISSSGARIFVFGGVKAKWGRLYGAEDCILLKVREGSARVGGDGRRPHTVPPRTRLPLLQPGWVTLSLTRAT